MWRCTPSRRAPGGGAADIWLIFVRVCGIVEWGKG